MAEAACVVNGNAWNVLLKVPKRLRKEREEFPREVFKTSPWQDIIDSGSYKQQTTKQCRKFCYCKRDLLLIHIVYLTRVYNKRRSARDSTKPN